MFRKKFNLKNKRDLKSLNLSDVQKIDQNIRGLYPKIGKDSKTTNI